MKDLGFVTLQISILFLFIFALTDVASHQLRFSAVGRFASLGEVYDIRDDAFTGENIFESHPAQNQDFIEFTPIDSKITKTQMVKNLLEKTKLMGIELPQAVNILDGSILPKGTSKYLLYSKDDANVPEAATFHRAETVKATLKIFRKSISPIMDNETLEHSLGTHVVVGISYGMNVILSLRAKSSEIDQDHMQNQLLDILQNLPSKYNQTFNKDLKFKIFSDIYLSRENIPDFGDTTAVVRSILNSTNQGRGVPLKYFLLPLKQIKNYFTIQTASSNFTAIEGILLEKVLKNFDQISNTNRQLQSEPLICYSEGDQSKIQNLTDNFERICEDFQSDVKRTLTLISTGELGKSSLTDLLNSFSASPYSPRNILKSFQKNTMASPTARLFACKTLVNNGIEYLNEDSNLWDILASTRTKPLFILMLNSSLICSDINSWQENLSLIFKLKKPWNRVLAADCEIFEDGCHDLNGTSIRQYLDLELISRNLLEDLRKNQMVPAELQIPAIGAPRQLGDLYDATSGTFLESTSVFQRKHSISLLSAFSKDESEMYPSVVTSNKWQQFLQALNIPQDQKLLILRKENILQKGLLKNFHSLRNQPNILQNSLLQTNIYEEECLNFEHDHINWPSLIDNNSFQSRATHFVQKIYKGSTTLVGVFHPNPEQEQNLMNHIKKIFDENLKRIENQRALNVTNLFQNIDPHTEFLILSDNKVLTPGKIYDLPKFQEFLTNFAEVSSQVKKPVGYVLKPLRNFQDKFGLLPKIPEIPNPVSPDTSEKILAVLDLLEDTSLQKRVLSWKNQMLKNSECILKTDQITLDAFAKDLENTTKFWKAELNLLLDTYRKQQNEDQEQIFLNFSTSFQETYPKVEEQESKLLQIVSSVKDKITFCKLCRESSVKYISSSTDYTSALLGDAGEERMYLMFYRQDWVQTMRDTWFRNHVKFFQTLPNLKRELGNNSTSSSRRYLVDCDFFTDASDRICANISLPTIHEYKNGLLVSQDLDFTLQQEEMTNRKFLEELQMTHQQFFVQTITNFNSINSTLSSLDTHVEGNSEVLRRVFIDNALRSPNAKLFTEANKTGNVELYQFKSATIKGGCYNLQKYSGKIKSVETDGSCVRLFSSSYCNNWSQAVYRGTTNIPDAKLNGVYSIGPCAPNEFVHSAIIKSPSAPPQLKKITSSLECFANVPDLIGDAYTRSGGTSVSITSNPVYHYLLGPGNRVEALRGNIYPRHLKSPASAENTRVAGLQQSFYSKLDLAGEGDEPGFVIPLELGGPADQIYNVFPQNRKQAGYFKMKIVPLVKQLLTDYSSHAVRLVFNFAYKNSNTTRPSGMWYQCYRNGEEVSYGYVPNSE